MVVNEYLKTSQRFPWLIEIEPGHQLEASLLPADS
jgi:hypothetical protein